MLKESNAFKAIEKNKMKNIIGGKVALGSGEGTMCWSTTCPDKKDERSGFGNDCPSEYLVKDCKCNEVVKC
ncbi:MAG: hypothetical protein JNJ41_02395 [Bacteroidia bacterium]|nr:hypothetical protein [Bacteroidia bacterium]